MDINKLKGTLDEKVSKVKEYLEIPRQLIHLETYDELDRLKSIWWAGFTKYDCQKSSLKVEGWSVASDFAGEHLSNQFVKDYKPSLITEIIVYGERN